MPRRPAAEAVPLEREALTRELSCPKCGKRFETHPYYGPGNVVIDNCASCDLLWLDFGEIRQIVDAPGRDRGSRLMPPTDDKALRAGAREDHDEDDTVPRRGDPLRFLIDVLLND